MKRSNIIIIAFSVFFIISTFVLFINAKNHKEEFEANNKTKTELVSSYSVLVGETNSNITIETSDSNFIKIDYSNEKQIQNNLYKIANDTLYVYAGNDITLSNKKIKSIILDDRAELRINKLSTDSLYINSSGGKIYLHDDTKAVNVKTLHIKSSMDTHIELYAEKTKIENLNVSLNNSRMDIYDGGIFKNVSLTLLNNSSSELSSALENISYLSIKKDSTENKIN